MKLPNCLAIATQALLLAQAPQFEVATIKPAGTRGGSSCPESLRIDGTFVYIRCATLPMLIGYAHRSSPDRVKGFEGRLTHYDIAATVPAGTSVNQVPEMVLALLNDRFKLALHRAPSKESIYALTVAKGGVRMRETSAPGEADTDGTLPGSFFGSVFTRTNNAVTRISSPQMGTVRQFDGPERRQQRWEGASISLPGLADLLDRVAPVSLPIVDMTGLAGRYEMVLDVTLSETTGTSTSRIGVAREPSGVGLDNKGMDREETVLRDFNMGLKKLGLQLERRRGTVESLVVDHVEKAPTGN